MGYTTDFEGHFVFNKPLDADTLKLMKGLATTRRMKRKVGSEFGVEGEFYIDGTGFAGQDNDATVINSNSPPRTQPSLWLQWIPNEDGTILEWDGGEKFYSYVEWLEYLIVKILQPRGYALAGEVKYQGEDPSDFGKIVLLHNQIVVMRGRQVYEDDSDDS